MSIVAIKPESGIYINKKSGRLKPLLEVESIENYFLALARWANAAAFNLPSVIVAVLDCRGGADPPPLFVLAGLKNRG